MINFFAGINKELHVGPYFLEMFLLCLYKIHISRVFLQSR